MVAREKRGELLLPLASLTSRTKYFIQVKVHSIREQQGAGTRTAHCSANGVKQTPAHGVCGPVLLRVLRSTRSDVLGHSCVICCVWACAFRGWEYRNKPDRLGDDSVEALVSLFGSHGLSWKSRLSEKDGGYPILVCIGSSV